MPAPQPSAVDSARDTTKRQRYAALEEEWEHGPVPAHARKGLASVGLAWLGFPMIVTGAVAGALLVAGLGFTGGMLAILAGNLVLLAYVGGLSGLAARSGLNFALLVRTTLGAQGGRVASGVMATVVVGWFAVQTGLTAESLHAAFGWNLVAMSVVAGLLYTAVTLLGMRTLTVLGAISAPMFLAFGIYAVVVAADGTSVGSIVGYEGAGGTKALTVGAALTIVIAQFIDSGTMTPDFTRWSGSRRDAWLATFSAFPVANGVAMVVGGFVAASAGSESGFFELITRSGGVVSAVAVFFLFVNLGNACSHCLYNAGMGWAQILGTRFRPVALVWGLLGTAIATAGVWSQFQSWLILLGVLVPPLGTVLLTDHLLVRRREADSRAFAITGLPDYQWAPIAAWGVGAGSALAANYLAPQLSVVMVGIVVTFAAHAGTVWFGRASSGVLAPSVAGSGGDDAR